MNHLKKFACALVLAVALPSGVAFADDVIGGLDSSPFDSSRQCLLGQLSSVPHDDVWTVGRTLDETGHVNYDTGDGDLSTQGIGESLYVGLSPFVTVTDTSFEYQKQYADWIQHESIANELMGSAGMAQLHKYTWLMPKYRITMNIVAADTGSGDVAELSLFGIGGGWQKAWLDIVMNVNVWQQPDGAMAGDKLVPGASFRIWQRVYSQAFKADAGVIAHGLITANFVIQHGGNVQYAEATMADEASLVALARTYKVKACNPQIAYDAANAKQAPSLPSPDHSSVDGSQAAR